MFKWGMGLLVLGVAVGCLMAMGVGAKSMAGLLLVIFLMAGVSLLIAWPFLRKQKPRS